MLSENDIRDKLVENFGKYYHQSKKLSEHPQKHGYDIIVIVKQEPTDG